MKDCITLSFKAKKENVRIVRAVVRNFLVLKGVYEQDIFDSELAIDEAVANIIEHTYNYDESKVIIMTLVWENNEMEVILRDFGEKVDPGKVKPRDLNDIREGGLGVYIIKKIFDVMEWKNIEGPGNLLYLRKKYQIALKKE